MSSSPLTPLGDSVPSNTPLPESPRTEIPPLDRLPPTIEQVTALGMQVQQLQTEVRELRAQLQAQHPTRPASPVPIADISATVQPKFPIATPEYYDGSADNTEEFLHECNLNFLSSSFTDRQKIIIAMGYMKKGRARSWAKKRTDELVKGKLKEDWELFQKAIKDAFGDADRAALARMKITDLKQGKSSVGDFITQFEEHEDVSGYDEVRLIEIFTNGLDPYILRAIYGFENPPTTLQGWKEKARSVYIN